MSENAKAVEIDLLLVDDDEDLRNDVASFLGTRGYPCSAAETANRR